MPSSGYTTITFVADELLTSSKMNDMAANDDSFNTGLGFDDGIIVARHMASASVGDAAWRNTHAFRAYQSTAQSIPTASITKISFQTENYDLSSNFDAATNYRFTAPFNGIYNFFGRAESQASQTSLTLFLYKNGTEVARGNFDSAGSTSRASVIADSEQLATNDTIELWIFQVGSTANLYNATSLTYFGGQLVSRT